MDDLAKELSLVEHLEELRKRLLLGMGFFVLAFIFSLFGATALYSFLTSQFTEKLLVLGPNDILMIYIQLASVSALALSLPFWAYQLWAYVKPALEPREAHLFLAYVPAVFVCFLAGLSFGFFCVSPTLLTVLLGLGENLFETQLTATNYMSFLFHTTVPLGLFFEFPVVIAFLTSLGILKSSWLVSYRKYAYFMLIVAAVVLTPADLMSDLALSVPLLFLYELSLLISKVIENRKEKKHGNS